MRNRASVAPRGGIAPAATCPATRTAADTGAWPRQADSGRPAPAAPVPGAPRSGPANRGLCGRKPPPARRAALRRCCLAVVFSRSDGVDFLCIRHYDCRCRPPCSANCEGFQKPRLYRRGFVYKDGCSCVLRPESPTRVRPQRRGGLQPPDTAVLRPSPLSPLCGSSGSRTK